MFVKIFAMSGINFYASRPNVGDLPLWHVA